MIREIGLSFPEKSEPRSTGIETAFLKKLSHKIARMLRGDDYNWSHYPEHYRQEMALSREKWTHHFVDYSYENGAIIPKGTAKPLHPNHQVLYQQFIDLGPASVLEVGCGWGYQLVMANRLAGAEPWGFDISKEQVKHSISDWPVLQDRLKVWDATRQFSGGAELVYSHAVIMHLSEKRARTALSNMVNAAERWVLLIENWASHDFERLLREIGVRDHEWIERGGAKGLLIRTQ